MKMSNKIAIYVPSRFGPEQKTNSELRVTLTLQIQEYLARSFGGSTVTYAEGAYIGNDGKLILESIAIVTAWTDHPDIVIRSAIKNCVARIMRHGQECVGVEYNGVFSLEQ